MPKDKQTVLVWADPCKEIYGWIPKYRPQYRVCIWEYTAPQEHYPNGAWHTGSEFLSKADNIVLAWMPLPDNFTETDYYDNIK